MTSSCGVDFAFKTLRLDVQRQGDTFKPSYITINPSVGLSYKSFYAAVSYERSLTTSSGYDQVPGARRRA